MNINITHNWLLDYLDTDATPSDIQKYLSLCGPSIEKIEKKDDDYVYEIEITTNRIDAASVFGMAQESYAILPQFGKKANIKENPLEKYKFTNIKGNGRNNSLQIKIMQPDLCSRFTAIVLSDIKLKEAPDFIKKRLQLCGIKSINNVIDVSNYLMLSLGQPTHTFDYDQIKNATMIMRESKKGEKLVTLDKKEITLPGGDIVIEDGNGELIDLCGIMGGLNSSVTEKTKNVLLFVQTYNKEKIRRTSMLTGQRTVAATYFEKGLDPERVEPTLTYGVELLTKFADAKVSSKLFDIYENPYKGKSIKVSQEEITRIMGENINRTNVESILKRLGFKVEEKDEVYDVSIPSYRANDVDIPEDIIEEVARVYGYFNLPNSIQSTIYIKQPKDIARFFTYREKIKYYLKHLGLNEVINYSMISKKQIDDLDENAKDYLRINNTISEDIEYLRKSLFPSLIKNIKDNTGKKEKLHFFEIAKVYKPKNDDLPEEINKLGFVVNSDFFTLKGIIEATLKEFNVKSYSFHPSSNRLFSQFQAKVSIDNHELGILGQLSTEFRLKNNIQSEIILAELDFETLIKHINPIAQYKPINPFAVIKLDWTEEVNPQNNFDKIKTISFKISKLLQNLEVIDIFNNKVTLRFYFSSTEKNITEEEAKSELEKIKKAIQE